MLPKAVQDLFKSFIEQLELKITHWRVITKQRQRQLSFLKARVFISSRVKFYVKISTRHRNKNTPAKP